MNPYYDDGAVRIYHGDCMRDFPLDERETPDHIISDPPYDKRTHDGARTLAEKHELLEGEFPPIEFADVRLCFDEWAPKFWCVSFQPWEHTARFKSEPSTELRFIRFGIWRKPNGAPQFTGDRPGMGWESICVLHRHRPGKMKWNGGGKHGVWRHNAVHGAHPTEKPLALMKELIEDFTQPGELILDPFMGSGTTLRAAKDTGRRAIGIEIEERWCEHAANRMRQGVLNLW